MDFRKKLRKILADTSVIFTILTAIYSLLMLIVNVSEDEVLMSATRVLLIFLFSALAAVAQAIFRTKSIPGAARLVLHFMILIAAFYLCFLLPAAMRPASLLIGLVTFTLLYFLVMGLASLFISKLRSNSEKDASYSSQFKKSR